MPDLDNLAINTIRTLAIDAVQQANSGHPGAPMGLAPVAYELWHNHLRYDPNAPQWPGRDRFVLSNGHASMLLYSVLYLAGVKGDHRRPVTLEEIKRFRQWDSCTPGHPESHLTTGVETTTGPLGQGLGNSVGMAIALKWLAATYCQPGFENLFDSHIYAICGDGCLMEGVSSEAASLAAHLKLDNLTWIWDDNSITIDGSTSIAFTEDVCARFIAYGWNVLKVADANDRIALAQALNDAKATKGKPTFIEVKGVIGFGSPKKAGTNHAHGEPLGEDEVKATKKTYGWPEDAKFLVPDGVLEHFRKGITDRSTQVKTAWEKSFAAYKATNPELGTQLEAIYAGKLPAGWDADLPVFPADAKGLATRASSGKALNGVAKRLPWMIGGSADLAKSNVTTLTFPEAKGDFQAATPAGRTINFGVREHAMGAICNGIALCGLRPFAAGFLIFSDYGRPPIRLAAIMDLPVLYIFTHDSIGVGEDGPTHQPIEQLANLRAVPNVTVIRPCDANEVSEAYRAALLNTHGPTILALSRQPVPTYDRTIFAATSGLMQGGYILAGGDTETPQVILIATGTEVSLCMEAYTKLVAEGVKARVVSLPSWELFEKQPQAYRDRVLPPTVTNRVCVEMASAFGWERYAGATGTIIAMRSFGASAPFKDLATKFGFTTEAVYQAAKKQLG